MEIKTKEKTALSPSVGADGGQSLQKMCTDSIPDNSEEYNDDFGDMEELYRRMQRAADPHYLNTVSMTELYQTSYKSRAAIIDGLI